MPQVCVSLKGTHFSHPQHLPPLHPLSIHVADVSQNLPAALTITGFPLLTSRVPLLPHPSLQGLRKGWRKPAWHGVGAGLLPMELWHAVTLEAVGSRPGNTLA